MPEPTQPAAVRLTDGLDRWRRKVARRRCRAAARRWSLIAAGAALAGAVAGRLDGRPLPTLTAAIAATLLGGVLAVARARNVRADEAARLLDARFSLDEQVATALYFSGTGHHNPLVSSLIEHAAELVAGKHDAQAPRTSAAYGEWAVMAVTAAAVAAVAATPGSHPGPGNTNGAGSVSVAAAGSATHPGAPAGRTRTLMPGAATPSSLAHGPGSAGGAGATTAAGAGGVSQSAQPRPSATSGPQASPPAGGPQAGGPQAGGPQAGGTQEAGTQAAGGAEATAAPAAGSGKPGTAQPAPAVSRAAQPASGRASAASQGTTRSGAARRAAAARGGVPGGDTAGTLPGSGRTSGALAQPLPNTGGKVLMIVLPGGDGRMAGRANSPSPARQPEGSGGTATVTSSASEGGVSAVYIAPDANEVLFFYQEIVGRYF